MPGEVLFIILIGALLLVGPTVTLVLAIVGFVRSRRIRELSDRISRLEETVAQFSATVPRSQAEPGLPPAGSARETFVVKSETARAEASDKLVAAIDRQLPPKLADASIPIHRQDPSSVSWEFFVGQRAFGWVAVILFIFAAAFFLRYAVQNNWIGPLGRVAIGQLVGVGLVVAGWRHFSSERHLIAGMLTAAGTVVLYLSIYAAFGFYRLLPQQHAGAFLGLVVIESMLVAVMYRQLPVALVAVLGGLITPVLMVSNVDEYPTFFMYLAA